MAAESAVRVIFLGDSSSAVRSVSRLETAFGSLGKTAKIAAGALAVGVVGGLAAATKAAIDFDRSMRNVNSIAKLSEGQFKSLEKQVLSLGKTTGQSPKVLADGLYDIVSSGFKANDAIKILAVSAKAATAGMTDTATASKAVVAILNAYHLSADKAKNVSSLLFTEVNKGVNTFEELAQNIGDTAPLAAQLKVPFSDVSAALALITLHGTSMAEASTQVSRVLTDLLKPSDSLKKTFHDLGYENGQAAIQAHGFIPLLEQLSDAAKGNATTTADWFQNIRSLRGVLNLTGPNLKLFNRFADDMATSFRKGGADVAAFNEQSKSISVQWQKAKSALTAAAIPIGQLFFPLLAKSADKVQDFAASIETHMPQIRAQFQQLGGVLQGFANTARTVFSNLGVAGTGGLLGVIFGAKGILAGKDFVAALTGAEGVLARLGPIGIAASVGIGALTYSLLAAGSNMHELADETRNLSQALDQARQAADQHRNTALNLQQAELTEIVTRRQVTQALNVWRAAVDASGRGSNAARDAYLNYRQALVTHKRALEDVKNAEKENTKAAKQDADAKVNQAQKIKDLTTKADNLFRAHSNVAQGLKNVQAAGGVTDKTLQNINAQQRANLVNDYANAIKNLTAALGGTKQEANLAAGAVRALSDAFGRLPTRKEVTLIVRLSGAASLGALEGGTTGPGRRGRAHGGFIPGATGAPVPILAHAGEVVLNPMQQEALGGAGMIARMFGFTGDEGPGFATGGIVNKPKRRGSGKSPHHPRGPRVRTKNKAARAALAAVDAINQREDDADRSYGQLVRQYDISQEQFIRQDADGKDYVSQPDINQRVAEIDSLIQARRHMLSLLAVEKKRLQHAIARLRKAIAAMIQAIRAEQKAVRELNAQIARENKKKKPNQNLISRWQNQIGAHQDRARTLSSTIGDFRSAIKDEQLNLGHQLPFDRRDVQLDIDTLQAERKDVVGTKLTATGGSSGGGGADTSANVEDLLRQIGQLKLALGIQTAQQAIIGSFAKGTLTVPQTGLALVHAGESITPAAYARGGNDGASIGDVQVNVHIDPAMDFLKDFIRVETVRATDQISLRQGTRASERLRSGRV